MTRSLAAAVTTVAFAGITFAGVAPAGAAPVGAKASAAANCDKYLDKVRQHKLAAEKYHRLAAVEADKAHPNKDKVRQYEAKWRDELYAANAYETEYYKCTH
ncbi:hypothetical protein [Streptomyces sp. NPDC048650]|uniref:hypothetical protein n=1 Tax=unclassified Streptomyces TaxID=2593676 RepID=UPI00370FA72F